MHDAHCDDEFIGISLTQQGIDGIEQVR